MTPLTPQQGVTYTPTHLWRSPSGETENATEAVASLLYDLSQSEILYAVDDPSTSGIDLEVYSRTLDGRIIRSEIRAWGDTRNEANTISSQVFLSSGGAGSTKIIQLGYNGRRTMENEAEGTIFHSWQDQISYTTPFIPKHSDAQPSNGFYHLEGGGTLRPPAEDQTSFELVPDERTNFNEPVSEGTVLFRRIPESTLFNEGGFIDRALDTAGVELAKPE